MHREQARVDRSESLATWSRCIVTYRAVQASAHASGRATADGRRDHALILALFNTGARVQEILGAMLTENGSIQTRRNRCFAITAVSP
jgi:hypothetical protein